MWPRARVLTISVGVFLLLYFNYNLFFPENMVEYAIAKTTTTPTPPNMLMFKMKNNLTIEKYNPVRAQALGIKAKLLMKSKQLSIHQRRLKPYYNTSNENVHMFFIDDWKLLQPKKNSDVEKKNHSDVEIVMQNLNFARLLGCGVLIIEYKLNTIRMALELAPKYNIKIAIAFNYYIQGTVLTVRRSLTEFLKNYGTHPALYRHEKYSLIIYMIHSFMTPSTKWKDLLSKNGAISIRDTPLNAIVLGHVRDEDHLEHVRRSRFDGLFTCCAGNGDYFATTWKNWRAIMNWAGERGLHSSMAVFEGPEGSLNVKAALNALLRSRPGPTFVSFDSLRNTDETVGLVQEWSTIWSNRSSVHPNFLL